MSKIGIFSGTFDPVHKGHITFALEAIRQTDLDKVYFLPEQTPRRKESVTHYAHRVAMLKLALKPHKDLQVLELPDRQFSMSKSLPRLKKMLPDSELSLLIGTDMLEMLGSAEAAKQWPDFDRLFSEVRLIVGVRTGVEEEAASKLLGTLQPSGVVVSAAHPHASSRDIRRAVMLGEDHDALLASLREYISENWLYAAVSPNNS